MKARFFKMIDNNYGQDDGIDLFYKFVKKQKGKVYTLLVNQEVFDEDNRLRFIRRTDWSDSFIEYYIEDDDDDDLPF